jgi:hypothetical protein
LGWLPLPLRHGQVCASCPRGDRGRGPCCWRRSLCASCVSRSFRERRLRGARSIRGFNCIQASSPILCACPRAERGARSALCPVCCLELCQPGRTKTGRSSSTASMPARQLPPIWPRKRLGLFGRSAMTDFLLAAAGLHSVHGGGWSRPRSRRTFERRSHDGGAAPRHRRNLLAPAGRFGDGMRGVDDVALGLALLAAFASVAFVISAAPPEVDDPHQADGG